MIKFLLVDDHNVVRSGTKALLYEVFKPCEIYEASDGESTVENLKLHSFDLIMMDIQMPNTDTLGLMDFIKIQYPASKVLIFSMSAEAIYAKRFLKAGAMGFLSKHAPLEEIKKAVTLILNDRKYISDKLANIFAEEAVTDRLDNPFNLLSPREFEIVFLLLSGHTLSEVSRLLNLQISTIGTHKSRLFSKLGVGNILDLRILASSYNL